MFAVLTDHLGHSAKQKPSGINRSLSEFCAAEFLCISVSTATLKTNYFTDLGFSFFLPLFLDWCVSLSQPWLEGSPTHQAVSLAGRALSQ